MQEVLAIPGHLRYALANIGGAPVSSATTSAFSSAVPAVSKWRSQVIAVILMAAIAGVFWVGIWPEYVHEKLTWSILLMIEYQVFE